MKHFLTPLAIAAALAATFAVSHKPAALSEITQAPGSHHDPPGAISISQCFFRTKYAPKSP